MSAPFDGGKLGIGGSLTPFSLRSSAWCLTRRQYQVRCLRLAELAGLIGVDDGELFAAVILSRPADKDVAGAELQIHTVGTGGLDQHVIAGGSPHPHHEILEE